MNAAESSPRERIAYYILKISAYFAGISLILFLLLVFTRRGGSAGTNATPVWSSGLLLAVLLLSALVAIKMATRKANLAIEAYSWVFTIAIGLMVLNHYSQFVGDKPPTILLCLHVAIFCLGLAKGFAASIRLTIAVLVMLIWVTFVSGKIGITLPMILAALAMNIPPWLVDRMELSLRRSEERFKLVFQDSADIQIIVDRLTSQILELNRSGMAMFRCSPEQYRGRPLAGFLPGGMQHMKLPELRSDTGRPPDVITLQARHLDGVTFPVEVTAALIPWGSSEAVLLILRDVTVRRHFEQELEHYRHHLEELVAERTSELELANRQLKERGVDLEEMNASLNAFSRMVAHDLKNPLTAVQGFNEFLMMDLESGDKSAIATHSQAISLNVQRMTRIIDELLLLASVQRKSEIPVKHLDMGKIWKEACERMENMIQEVGAKLSGPDEWPVVLGHEPWIEEVWVNYLSNALKYSGRREEGITPKIEAGWTRCSKTVSPQEEQGVAVTSSMIKFWIQDNGPGIPAEARQRLFHEFVRLEPDRAPGYGLGLSIVNRIVTHLGGKVGVESRHGEGSRFTFTLPELE